MIKDTLIAIVRAGEDALAAGGGEAPRVEARHVRGAALDWPDAAAITVRNGSLDAVTLSFASPPPGADPLAAAAAIFAQALGARLPTPRAIGSWRRLAVAASRAPLTGPRCFTVRWRNARGELCAAAELFSRGHYEAARASGFIADVTRRYLPGELVSGQTLTRELDVLHALALAAKLEVDLAVDVGGGAAPASAVILGRHREQDGGGVVLSVDADEELQPGAALGLCFGLQGRTLHWRCRVVRREPVRLVRDATLAAVVVTAPAAVEIGQRRGEFRLAPRGMACRLRPADPAPPPHPGPGEALAVPADACEAEVADLSFSGMGVTGAEDLARLFPAGLRVDAWLDLPGHRQPVRLGAVVRQTGIYLSGRNRRQGRLGLEFQARDDAERRALDDVSRHVMSLEREQAFQRALAAERQVT